MIPNDLRQLLGPALAATPIEIRANRDGNLVVTAHILGLVPVSTIVKPDDVLAGRYGRSFNLDMTRPGSAILTGGFQLQGAPIEVPQFDLGQLGIAETFSRLNISLPADNLVQFKGTLRNWSARRIEATAKVTRLAPGRYDLEFKDTLVGDGRWHLPPLLVGLAIWCYLKLIRRIPGVSWAGGSHVRVDLPTALGPA